MNVIKFQGGLGNQMFQYALYRRFEEMGIEVKADLTWFEDNNAEVTRPFLLDAFKIELNMADKAYVSRYRNFLSKRFKHNFGLWPMIHTEKESGSFEEDIFKRKNTLFDGYWQSSRYFDEIKGKLTEDFKFPNPVSPKEEELLKDIINTESVSIHIRCGDYLLHDDIYGGICTPEYYKKAIIEVLKEKQDKDIKFFVFSDESERAGKMLEGIASDIKTMLNICFVELPQGTGEIHDMALMKNCKHNIIANSSFSFWASYLNTNEGKTIYAPSRWKNNKDCSDIFCKDWKIVD